MQEPTHAYPQSASLNEGSHLLRVGGAGRLHVGIFIALAILIASGWLIRFSAAGFRLVAVGENPIAAERAGGIKVSRLVFNVLVVSGALAGLAGAIEVFGVTYALYEDISPGYGFTAIAVALLAQLDPWRVILSAVGFAALETGASAMQRDAGIPSTLASIIEALVILLLLSMRGDGFSARQSTVPSGKASE